MNIAQPFAAFTPAQFQTIALAWLGSVSIVGGAAYAFILKVLPRLAELVARVEALLALLRKPVEGAPEEPRAAGTTPEQNTRVLPPDQPRRPGGGATTDGGAARLPLLVTLVLLTWSLFAIVGCASTTIKDGRTGRTLLHTQGNWTSIYFHGGGYVLQGSVDHSTATLAGGHAFAQGVNSVGTTIVSGIIAGGGFPWAKAAAAGTTIAGPLATSLTPAVLQGRVASPPVASTSAPQPAALLAK